MNTKTLIENYYTAFNAKKFSEMTVLLTEDVVHDISQGSRETGRTTFIEFISMMDYHYDENLTNIVVMVSEDGTRAAAEFICNGIYKKTAAGLPEARGQKYSLPVGCFFEIKNNKIARVSNHYNLNDWVNQVK